MVPNRKVPSSSSFSKPGETSQLIRSSDSCLAAISCDESVLAS
jgi:hypothetical protein